MTPPLDEKCGKAPYHVSNDALNKSEENRTDGNGAAASSDPRQLQHHHQHQHQDHHKQQQRRQPPPRLRRPRLPLLLLMRLLMPLLLQLLLLPTATTPRSPCLVLAEGFARIACQKHRQPRHSQFWRPQNLLRNDFVLRVSGLTSNLFLQHHHVHT